MTKILTLTRDAEASHSIDIALFAETRYQHLAVFDSEEALRLLTRTEVDLLLMDEILPGTDSWTLYQSLRVEPTLHTIGIVLMLTQHRVSEAEARRLKAIIASGGGLITKPIARKELIMTLGLVLRNLGKG